MSEFPTSFNKKILWVSITACLVTFVLLLLAIISVLTGWFELIENNWLIVIFKILAGFESFNQGSLEILNLLDVLFMILIFLISLALYKILKDASKLLSIIAAILPLAGIVVFLITHVAGRSSVFVWGMIFSALMLKSEKFKNITGIIGLLANILLFAGDLIVLQPFPYAIFMAFGYLLLMAYLILISIRLFKLTRNE